MLRTQIMPSEGRIQMAVHGDLDVIGAGELRSCICDILRTYRPGQVDIDLSGVDFIDCSGCRTLLWADTRVRGRGGTMAVVRPSTLVLRLLRLLEFDRELSIRTSQDMDLTTPRREVNPGPN
ncbi:STAS domain-containing protein [Planotetraspora sp. GP83]|uniref:STAS domain-containing protein n=1 Tax=Planotetraspora sp. GP83 TaxID=3156264 RepID=UPI003512C775